MQEEFEKKIRERMHTFGIQPAHQVWDEVDAVLNRQKHRRFFVGWWILLGLVVLGGAILLFDKDGINNDKLNQQPIITNDTTNNNRFAEKPKTPGSENKIPTQNNDNNGDKALSLTNTNGNNTNKNTVAAIHNNTVGSIPQAAALKQKGSFSINSHLPAIGNKQTGLIAGNSGEIAKVTPQAAAKNSTEDMANNTADSGSNSTRLALLNGDADSAVMPPKLPRDTAGAFAKPDKTDPTNRTQPFEAKTIANPKSKWFLTFSAGTTQTISSSAINGATVPSNFNLAGASYANIPAITALNAYKYNLAQPGIGFHISAGGLYERQLSSHWNVFGGVSVAFLSNTQQTGVEYKGYLAVSSNSTSNLLSPQITLQSYYQPGTTGTVVNKAWQANVPIGVGYVFNPKSKTKFILNGGFSFAWLFNSAWLIPDTRYDKLYYSKIVFNNTSVNWQVGPAIEFKNQLRFGLQYQQSFTTLAKNYVTPKLYWQNISVYTAIPLGKGKRHK